jgi:hypothetical protein
MGFLELRVYKADARNECFDVGAGGFGRSGGNLHWRLAQCRKHMGGIEAPDAMAFQQLGGSCLVDAHSLGRRGYQFPQFQQPLGAKVCLELQHGGKVAPKLLAQAVGEPVTLSAKIACDAGPLAQLDNSGIEGGQQAEAVRIGAHRRSHDLGVAAIVLGSCQGEAVPEAIHLLRIDGVDREAALDRRLHDGAVRHLDGDVDLAGTGSTACQQPGGHLSQAFPAMLKDFLADFAPATISQKDVMAFARPVHAGIPSLFSHAFSPLETASRRNLRRSLYWRSESRSQVRRGLPTGHRLRPIRQGRASSLGDWLAGGPLAAPAGPARFLEITLIWAVAR